MRHACSRNNTASHRRLTLHRTLSLAAIGMLGAATLAGCTSLGPSAADAESTVSTFEEALVASDSSAACAQLSPPAAEAVETLTGESCEAGILSLDLPAQAGATPTAETPDPAATDVVGRPTGTDVYGRSALVRSSIDAVFLTLVDGQWRIRAAGCTPVQDAPFDCLLEGS